MYCPRCSSQAVEGQRFCRNCGIDLGLILDAMEGKARGPLDFENLKKDLRELGANLKAGFEEANIAVKRTKRLDLQGGMAGQAIQMPVWTREIDRALRKVKAAHTRKYSLQQSALSIFSGGAIMAAWYYILNAAASSGVIESIEQVILTETGNPVTGISAVVRLLWVLGLIPVAKGAAHLINGIFFVPKSIENEEPPAVQSVPGFSSTYMPSYSSPVGEVDTNDLNRREKAGAQSSIVEDDTVRFGQ